MINAVHVYSCQLPRIQYMHSDKYTSCKQVHHLQRQNTQVLPSVRNKSPISANRRS